MLSRVQFSRSGSVRNAAARTFALVFLVIASADLWAVFAGHDALRPFTKPLLMPVLAGFALVTVRRRDRSRDWLVVALLCSALGDTLLLSQSDTAFVEGTLAFALAHVAYIVCFSLTGSGAGLVRKHPWLAIPYLAGWTWATAFVAPHMGVLAFVAVPYSLLLASMALVALDLVGRIPLRGAMSVAAGAALFMSSDTNIAIARFDPTLALPHVAFAIMALYLAGQTLIVLGLASPQVLNSEPLA
jgi:uncharacterized membrane protein YhhN